MRVNSANDLTRAGIQIVAWERTLKNVIIDFLRDESGLTTVEYAVAGTLITIAVVGAFAALGGSVSGTITIMDGALPG